MTATSGGPAVALSVDVPGAPTRSILRDGRSELRSVARRRRAFEEPEEVIPEYVEAAKRARGPLRAAV